VNRDPIDCGQKQERNNAKPSSLVTRGVSHCGLAIYIKKYLKTKEESWKLKYFTMQKNIIFKKSSKRNKKILQGIITL
jgi:hypothetical protein